MIKFRINLSSLQSFLCMAAVLAGLLLSQASTQLKWVANASFHIQPGFWAVLSLVGMVIFAVCAIVTDKTYETKHDTLPGSSRSAYHWQRHIIPIEYAAYFMCYVLLVPWLGYLLSTVLVFVLMVFRAGYRHLKMFYFAILVGVTIVVLFKTLLQVKIPGGQLYELFPEGIRNFLILNF